MTTASRPTLADPDLWRDRAPIAGAWRAAEGGGTCAVHNPADGTLLGTVPDMGAAETRQAIDAADAAFPAWAARTAKERAQVLRRMHDLMLAHQEDLARLMTAEQGKPLAEARGEIAYAAGYFEWFGEEAKRMDGEVIPGHVAGTRLLTLRQPVGVVAAITPWNFPAAMLARKLAPALAAGCTVVVKPAEQTPLTALALAELAQRAGIPAGVLNLLTADGPQSIAVGKLLCESPVVRHLSFTGSTEVGRILARQSADTIKKLSLELGGNAPFIVFDDADMDSAIEGALASKYRNAGQTCVCANRLYVQDGVYDEFVRRLAERVAAMPVGNGFAPGVLQGPLIDDDAVAKVEAHVADALGKGARLVTGGQRLEGRFYAPTVLADVNASMLCAREETFGPLAPVFRFKTEQEAIEAANNTEFGLASYFFSRDLGRVFRVSEALEYGMVGVNTGLISTAEVPFGGVKQSGLGREGAHQGMDDYVEVKYICLADIQK